jgi:hypothetical protein
VLLTSIFDIIDLKPECLHAVIQSVALLAALGETLGLLLPEPIGLDKEGLHKPTSDMKSKMFMPACETGTWNWKPQVPWSIPFPLIVRPQPALQAGSRCPLGYA